MKTFATVAIAATLVAKTLAYSTDPCPNDELVKLLGLAGAPGLTSCQDATGFTFVPPSGYPSDDQIFVMCALDDCRSTLAFLEGLNPSDCQIEFAGVTLNVKNISDSFRPKCKELGFEW